MDIITLVAGVIFGLSTANANPGLHPDGPTIIINQTYAGATWIDERGMDKKGNGFDKECIAILTVQGERINECWRLR